MKFTYCKIYYDNTLWTSFFLVINLTCIECIFRNIFLNRLLYCIQSVSKISASLCIFYFYFEYDDLDHRLLNEHCLFSETPCTIFFITELIIGTMAILLVYVIHNASAKFISQTICESSLHLS